MKKTAFVLSLVAAVSLSAILTGCSGDEPVPTTNDIDAKLKGLPPPQGEELMAPMGGGGKKPTAPKSSAPTSSAPAPGAGPPTK